MKIADFTSTSQDCPAGSHNPVSITASIYVVDDDLTQTIVPSNFFSSTPDPSVQQSVTPPPVAPNLPWQPNLLACPVVDYQLGYSNTTLPGDQQPLYYYRERW